MYLAKLLINLKREPQIFYKIDLLLKYQNKECKYCQADCGSSLKESNKIFQLYVVLVDILRKIWYLINQIVIRKQEDDYYL